MYEDRYAQDYARRAENGVKVYLLMKEPGDGNSHAHLREAISVHVDYWQNIDVHVVDDMGDVRVNPIQCQQLIEDIQSLNSKRNK